jgi:uncharacterized protein (DUF849 family)
MNDEVVITCAVTGSADTAKLHPALPITPEQIARSATDAAKAGAAVPVKPDAPATNVLSARNCRKRSRPRLLFAYSGGASSYCTESSVISCHGAFEPTKI